MAEYCEVAFPVNTRRLFTYRAGELAGRLEPGQRVRAPFGRRTLAGFVVSTAATPAFPGGEIRTLAGLVDQDPLLTPPLVTLARWVAEYYCAGLGETLNAALSATLSPPRRPVSDTEDTLYQATLPGLAEHPLTAGQQEMLDGILPLLDAPVRRPILLQGVASSGKTEIYLRLAEAVADRGGQTLLLVPDIALTAQVETWAGSYFGGRTAVLHSRLAMAERYRLLRRARAGETPLVIGTRSAVFTPLARTGLIIVDEEFDRSFKETRAPRYHARETALKRGEIENAPVILGGATPSLEAYHRAGKDDFRFFRLRKRVGEVPPPRVHVADLRDFSPRARRRQTPLVSEGLRRLTEEKLLKNEQVLILVNRRGQATHLVCRDCGRLMRCPECLVNLVFHRTTGELYCHYCNRRETVPEKCAGCGGRALGQKSVGIRAVEKEMKKLFPGVPIMVAEGGAHPRRGESDPFEEFRRGRCRILLGTRLVARGHHFPGVTLAAVIGADFPLNLPDFRAAENTFQLLAQFAGRAGRCLPDAAVLIQTRHPENYAVACAASSDSDGFYEKELAFRAETGYPPCGHMVNIVFTGRKEAALVEKTAAWARRLEETAEKQGGATEVLGPAACYHKKLRDLYRRHIMLKAPRAGDNLALLRELPELSAGRGIVIDVDPLDVL